MKFVKSSLRIIFFTTLITVSNLHAQKDKGNSGKVIASKYNIDNCVNSLSADKTIKTDAGYQYWFVDKNFIDGRTIKLSVVAPHKATHAPHIHAEDEFFFILKGKAEFYLNGEKRIVGPMTSLYCPSNVEHGIRNAGNKELKYLVIKKYQR